MKRKISSFLLSSIVFCCTLFFNANAQEVTNIFATPSTIDPKRLTGIWNLADSTHYTIEFLDYPADFILRTNGGGAYYFSKDSTGHIYSRGVMAAWPPFDCELQFLSNDTLKITHSQMGYVGVSYVYVRKKL
ncbi:MAG: hypothetical protein V4685_01355 [Bacteroidota bacterium]